MRTEAFEWFTDATFALYARGFERLGECGHRTLYRSRHGSGAAELEWLPGVVKVTFYERRA